MHFVSEDARLRAAAPGLTQSLAESLASACPAALKIGNFFADRSDAMSIIGMSR